MYACFVLITCPYFKLVQKIDIVFIQERKEDILNKQGLVK